MNLILSVAVHHGPLLLNIQIIPSCVLWVTAFISAFMSTSESLFKEFWEFPMRSKHKSIGLLAGISVEPGRQQLHDCLRLRSSEERGKHLILSGAGCITAFQYQPNTAATKFYQPLNHSCSCKHLYKEKMVWGCNTHSCSSSLAFQSPKKHQPIN